MQFMNLSRKRSRAMIKAIVGFTLLALGVSTADSEHVLIPLVLVIIGSAFLFIYQKEFDDEE